MTTPTPASPPVDHQPTLTQDRAFWGMTITQWLGAFNDNVYRQMVLLLCLTVFASTTDVDWQPLAFAIFSLPFILFSGLAGYLSDRHSKRHIIVLSKLGEVTVMAAGALAFWTLSQPLVFIVLFFMGTQTAFFGPSKYGILPELFRNRDLPFVNGIIQTVTFLGILLGGAVAGALFDVWENEVWIIGLFCVTIGLAGTLTSLLIRPTPVARPGLTLNLDTLAIHHDTRALLWKDGLLLTGILVLAYFFFVGGVIHQSVNALALEELTFTQLDDLRGTVAGILLAAIAVGLIVGGPLAGLLSRGQVNFRLVTLGAVGIACCLAGIGLLGWYQTKLGDYTKVGLVVGGLFGMGFFGGFYAVPLQTFLQSRPPTESKGRVIAAFNLIQWIFTFAAAPAYGCLELLGLPSTQKFLVAGALILPIPLLLPARPDQIGSDT